MDCVCSVLTPACAATLLSCVPLLPAYRLTTLVCAVSRRDLLPLCTAHAIQRTSTTLAVHSFRMSLQYAPHADSGSESDSEHDRLVGSRSSGRSGSSHMHSGPAPSSSSSSAGRLPQCCCKITPFNGCVMLLAVMGVALVSAEKDTGE